ncbi:MAG: NifB/NifX family molybdenum-iron cluster-binding protein [Elusimicrobiota bacterium]
MDKTECEHPEEKEHHTKEEKKVRSEMKSASGGKICITSQGNNLDAQVDPRFGRCQYFIIVDSETLKFEVVENPNIGATGGAGIQSAQLIASKGAGVVMTGNVGPNAFQTLQAAGIEVITGISGSVKEAVEKYKKGDITSTDSATVPGHFGMGNR